MDIRLLASVITASAVAVTIILLAGLQLIRKQRNQVVEALIKAEEGERRTYKIDLDDLQIDSLVGTGTFGFVYRGMYRGAEVAVKKLKQQYMSKMEIENFLRESSVMVGLRHPSIRKI